jgi:predicted amidohydrolase YtcJ
MNKWAVLNPDYIFFNGQVHSVDADDSLASALAVGGNRILATGSDTEILALATDSTQRIDLRGRSLIPGILDTHAHAMETGLFFKGIFVNGIPSIKNMCEAVRSRLEGVPAGEWLQGGSWLETQFTENRFPTRFDLDPVSPENPVVIERIFSTSCCNSMALKLAGIDKNTPDPPGGEIQRDPRTGEPTGILHRSAKALVRRVSPAGNEAAGLTGASLEDMQEQVILAGQEFIKYGITGTLEAGVSPDECRAYQNLWAAGRLPVRTALMPNYYGFTVTQQMEQMERFVDEFGFYTGYGNDWIKISGLKMAIDGGLTSKTALKSWEYLGGDPEGPVPLRLDLDKLNGWVKLAHDAGWSVGIHVMGDIAIQRAVDAIYAAHLDNPSEKRHQLIHCYYPSEDSLAKMAEAKMVVAAQPAFTYGEADGYPGLLPQDKQESFLPLRTCIDRGITVANSSDSPSAHFNPFWGMYSAVTRKGVQGHQLGTSECISTSEALRCMTINGAYMTMEDDIKGSLEPGKLADLVVLDRDLNATDSEDLRHINAVLTMIDGKIVYQK